VIGSTMSISLQDSVDRFARALTVPRRLLALHPRKRGNSGDAAALAPAITLGVISAFEGFVEEFTAVGAYSRGSGLAHVAKAVGALNNPDVGRFERLVVGQLGLPASSVGVGFDVDYWRPPPPGKTWWHVDTLDWEGAKGAAESWMQVRHALTHGLTSGWRAEVWPAPIRNDARPASDVLRETSGGSHTLVIHGAITCARIYVETARHLASLAASHLGNQIDLTVVPEFPLYGDEARGADVADGAEDPAAEAVEEGDEPPRDG
jgi:hypothetical protein